MRNFYAIEYAYGKLAENNGARADMLVVFASVNDRDAWIGEGLDNIGSSGYREAAFASDARVRAALKDNPTRVMLDAQGWAGIR